MCHNRDERKIHLSAYIEDQLAMKELHHKTVLSYSGVVYATKVRFFNQTYFQFETNSITL